MFILLLGIIIGSFLAMQTAVNSHLKSYLGSVFVASLISFTIGSIYLFVILLVSGQSLYLESSIFTDSPWWLWLGGVLGVIVLTMNIFLFKALGSVEAAVLPIFGNIIMGMMIDHFGFYRAPVERFDSTRLVGVLLLVIGITFAVVLKSYLYNRKQGTLGLEKSTEGTTWIWRIVGIFVGMCTATQVAVNGQLGLVLESKIYAAFVSFFVGFIVILIIVLIRRDNVLEIKNIFREKAPFFVWLGGVLGATFILGNVYLATTIGTGQTVVLTLFGMMLGSIIIQQFGLFKSIKTDITMIQILGLLIMLSGIVIIQVM